MNIKTLKIYILSLTLLITSGCYYQISETKKDLAENPPIGKIVEANGIKYHLNCTGEGETTVILEAGLGKSSLSWYWVQKDIEKKTRVCSYDRAGLGWSSGNNEKMSTEKVAKNLNKLLTNAEIKPPFILVGHSRGGIFCRNYYRLFPKEVKGMILVDSTHENEPFLELKYAQWDYFKQQLQINIAGTLSEIGFIRIMGLANTNSIPLPEKIIKAKNAVQNRTETAKAVVNEIKVMRESLNTFIPKLDSLNDLPLIVITSGKRLDFKEVRKNASLKHKSVGDEINIAKIGKSLQHELVLLSSDSKQIIAKQSGHMIMYDQPDLIINAINEMVEKAKYENNLK